MEKYLIDFFIYLIVQLIAIIPVWWFIRYIMKRQHEVERKVNNMIDMNNARSYVSAKVAVEYFDQQATLTQQEQHAYARAKQVIADFERDYKKPDPANN
jgi:hypothetical protein